MIWIGMIAVGLALRIWSILAMRGAFSLQLRLPHYIVTTGPYRWVRHPSYIGSLCIIVGAGMLHPVAGLGLVAFAFFLARSINEEAILMNHPAYREYAERTGRFIPKVRCFHG